jgi:hypothetical protein
VKPSHHFWNSLFQRNKATRKSDALITVKRCSDVKVANYINPNGLLQQLRTEKIRNK